MDQQLSRQVLFLSQAGEFLFFVHRAVDLVSASRLVCQVKEKGFANKK